MRFIAAGVFKPEKQSKTSVRLKEDMATLIVLAGLAYSFAPNAEARYRLDVTMAGYLPVLGGRDGVAKLQIDFVVTGLAADDSLPRTEHRPLQFKAWLNDAPLPFNLENVSSFFPKAIVTFWPNGKVKSTTAPDKPLPASLPGLDLRRFAEMTYLPCEFPQSGAERWNFTREMGGWPMRFEARISGKNGTAVTVELTPSQKATGYEDTEHRPLKDSKGAEHKVDHTISGKGSFVFDSERGQVERLEMEAETVSEVRGITNDFAATRRLKTTVTLRRLAENGH